MTFTDSRTLKVIAADGSLMTVHFNDQRQVVLSYAGRQVTIVPNYRYSFAEGTNFAAFMHSEAGFTVNCFYSGGWGYVEISEHRTVSPSGAGSTGIPLYFLHTDQLATIHAITDENQQVVWRGEHDAFGKTHASIGLIDNPLRFPGQYEDAETGLYYNWHRYYNPETGRYISSDPIGLAGGLNTFGYALGNPLSYVDPFGLINLQISGTSGETSIHANPGPDVTDFRPEHDPPHVHLGANDGPRAWYWQSCTASVGKLRWPS